MYDFKEIIEYTERLRTGPADPEGLFTSSRTHGRLYAMAAHLQQVMKSSPADADPASPPPPRTGFPSGSRVVCLGSDDKFLVAAAMLAGLGAGAPLVLPHALSGNVLAEMQAETGYRRAITDRPREFPAAVEQILPDRLGKDLSWPLKGAPRDPDAIYAWLFTGGSTGRPQLWSKSIRNLWGEALNLARTFQVGADDRILATVPPNHIYGLLFSVLLSMVSGAQLIEETPVYPREIISAMEKRRATILVSVPVHYLALQTYNLPGHRPRLAFSSGGMLDARAGKAFTRNTGVPVVEVYGSTETGGIAIRCRAAGEETFRPFSAVDWKIAKEYLGVNSSFLSAELPRDAVGYFITGDRVRSGASGDFELLGREDGIVKVGGKRVDLDQVRETLLRIPGVQAAVVLPVQASKGHGTGIAALVAGGTTPETLKKQLHSRLEPHARPRRIRVVARIPLTPAGKQDRQAIERMLGSS